MSELLLSILRAAAVHTGYTLVCVAAGFVLGLALGFVPAVLMDRAISASKAPEFSILKQLR